MVFRLLILIMELMYFLILVTFWYLLLSVTCYFLILVTFLYFCHFLTLCVTFCYILVYSGTFWYILIYYVTFCYLPAVTFVLLSCYLWVLSSYFRVTFELHSCYTRVTLVLLSINYRLLPSATVFLSQHFWYFMWPSEFLSDSVL